MSYQASPSTTRPEFFSAVHHDMKPVPQADLSTANKIDGVLQLDGRGWSADAPTNEFGAQATHP